MWLQGSPGSGREAQAAGHGLGLAALFVHERLTFGPTQNSLAGDSSLPRHEHRAHPLLGYSTHLSAELAVHRIRSSRRDFAGSWFGFQTDVEAFGLVQFVEF